MIFFFTFFVCFFVHPQCLLLNLYCSRTRLHLADHEAYVKFFNESDFGYLLVGVESALRALQRLLGTLAQNLRLVTLLHWTQRRPESTGWRRLVFSCILHFMEFRTKPSSGKSLLLRGF